jgi:hypothetical protein
MGCVHAGTKSRDWPSALVCANVFIFLIATSSTKANWKHKLKLCFKNNLHEKEMEKDKQENWFYVGGLYRLWAPY